MFKRLMKMKEDKKGFTLAELLIVVAIIGVLVAISVPIFTAQLKKATVATGKSEVTGATGSAIDSDIPGWNASTTGAADATHKAWYVTVNKDTGEVSSILYQ